MMPPDLDRQGGVRTSEQLWNRRAILVARGWVECLRCEDAEGCDFCVDGLTPVPVKVGSISRAEALGRRKPSADQVRTVLIEDARRMKR